MPPTDTSRSAHQQPGLEPSDASKPLSPEERLEFERCCELIKKGPRTMEAIGRALWTVIHQRLYRGVVANAETFLDLCAKIEPEQGLKLVAEWKRLHPDATSRSGAPQVKQSPHAKVADAVPTSQLKLLNQPARHAVPKTARSAF
jgi:hypothetical protein